MPTGRTIALILLLSAPLAFSGIAPAAVWVTVFGDLAVALLALLDWLALRRIALVAAERECPEVLSLGVANPVELRLRSRAPMGLHVAVADEPPVQFGFGAGSATGWIGPHGAWRHSYHLTPAKRGDYEFGPLTVRFTSRLGLVWRQRTYPLPCPIKVYPNVAQLRQYELAARRDQLALMGLHRLRQPAAATQFDSLRDHQPGDDVRWVEWKATARRGKLVVKQFDVERMQHVTLLLDCGRTMASQVEGISKLDYALNACVLLSHVAAGMEDRVGLLAFADEVIGYLPPGKGRHQAARLVDFVYGLEPRIVESDYRLAFTTLSARLRRRSLVVAMTDLIDPESSSRLLRYLPLLSARHHVLCVALSDWELDAELRQVPADPGELYEQVVALSVREDRERALARLRGSRVSVLNASPSDLSVATVNSYLALRGAAGA